VKTVLLLAALVVVAVALPSEAEIKGLFAGFVGQYNKRYTAAEVPTRYANFKASLARAEALQSSSSDAQFGITKFSDMSVEEFRSVILMKNKIAESEQEAVPATTLLAPGAPATFDWRDKDAVTPVKDQGQCGSCWAFSATEAVESAWILKGHATSKTIDLSAQQIVDCDTDGVQGCNGGFTESAYKYIAGAGGQEQIPDYPYTAKDGKCKFEVSKVDAKISTFTAIPKDETALTGHLSSTGPLSICLDAAHWQDYKSGVLSSLQCCPFIKCQMDHCVQLVGYNSTASNPYWIVRNSWNTDWGVAGYIWLEMGKNSCGITNDVTWPTVA